jgi:CheY-like chemotaxis protein/DnaJ-domain-containing protein 1
LAATILCADDDRNLCQILTRALVGAGYEVEIAHDGETALERVRALRPALVTLDVLLPRRDGFAVLEAIRRDAQLRETPVFLLSGCTLTDAYRRRAESLRADAILVKPVPLAELLEVVAKQIDSGPDARGARRARAEASVQLTGRLEEMPVAALLHHLHGLRASGVLELVAGKKKKQIQLRDGHPVAVRSNLVNETLGHLLVASGTITWDAMHESLTRVKRGEGLQGQILVAMHMLDEADLARALRNQADEKLFEAFAWTRGTYRFHRGARVKSANALTVKRGPADVILEGVRRRAPLALVDEFLAERAARYPVQGESPFYRFQELPLDASAHALLERLDGSRRIADVEPLDEVARRTLYGLLALEMLELRDAPAAPRRPAPEPVPPPPRTSRPIVETRRAPPAHRGAEPDEAPDPHAKLRNELAALAEGFRKRDYFQILGVGENASDEEIRHAYTALAKRTHPDRFAGCGDAVIRLAEEVFGVVSRAYETIGERDQRLAHLRDRSSRARDEAELEEGHRALRAELEFQKGEAALRARRYDAAADHFKAAVDAYPEEGEYRAFYGWAYYLCDPEAPGRVRDALEHVLQGRKLAPDREKPYLFLGRLYKAAGRDRMAEKMFTRAVQLDPDCLEALRELRLIHMRRERSRGLVRRLLRR